jgi:hypothetical protein
MQYESSGNGGSRDLCMLVRKIIQDAGKLGTLEWDVVPFVTSLHFGSKEAGSWAEF